MLLNCRQIAELEYKKVIEELVADVFKKISEGNVARLICDLDSIPEANISELRNMVSRICRLNHDLIPSLRFDGCLLEVSSAFCYIFFCSILSSALQLRKEILDLNAMFECKGGWALEATFNKWACKQAWRAVLPLSFCESLGIAV